ncbi:hypothetical protein KEM48_013210 [Puccinia striiformis f. sp. tritici PST-130]|nr:hypothetical protein KEM48_013210 [Puccinia striiformis f. sp. tritici PST-130]
MQVAKIMGPWIQNLFTPHKYVKQVLACKASVIIDLHNYARRDGKVIGEAQITDCFFSNFWTQLAKNSRLS